MNNPFSLEGKTVLVTGAASGIGKATAIQCAEMGARVIIVDLNEQGLQETQKLIEREDTECRALDLTNLDKLIEMVGSLPKLDGLASNAGMVLSLLAKFSEPKDMERIFSINTFSHINLVQQLIVQKKLNKGASIVFTSSMSGVYCGLAGGSLYGATKSAILGYTKALAIELAPRGIRVNTVHPGGILTEMLKAVYAATPALWDRVKETSPLAPHVADPIDIANGVLFLASDEARCVTGAELVIDCGYMAH